MSDIQLNVGGDASGAERALADMADAAKDSAATTESALKGVAAKTEAAFKRMEQEVSASMQKLTKEGEEAWKAAEAREKGGIARLGFLRMGYAAAAVAVVKFGVDATKAYAEGERVSRQLERVAGGHAAMFEEQAEAIARLTAVDGDLIKRQQMMLLQWGAAPPVVEATTRAILDYAAFTETDAVGATEKLIKAVESSDSAFKLLGVRYVESGDKAENHRRLVEALAKQYGGAAELNANSLSGAAHAAGEAFGDLKKTFGSFIALAEEKTGVLGKVTSMVRAWAEYQSGAINSLRGEKPRRTDQPADFNEVGPSFKLIPPPGATGEDAANTRTGAMRKHNDEMAKLYEKNNDDYRAYLKREEEADDKATDAKEKTHEELLASHRRLAESLEKTRQKEMDDEADFYAKSGEVVAAQLRKNAEEEVKIRADAAERVAEVEKHAADQARQAADQIGAAFVNALTDQLNKLAEGEEFDPSALVEAILITTISAAATIIGSAYGMPALGAAVGSLAGMGIKAGFASGRPKKPRAYHDGGWVEPDEAPRFHAGMLPGEMPAILQEGEAVLSRANVAAMGGRQGVESAKRGGAGGGLTVNITAMDTQSVKESFMDRGARGLREALRTGIGPLPQLLPQGSR